MSTCAVFHRLVINLSTLKPTVPLNISFVEHQVLHNYSYIFRFSGTSYTIPCSRINTLLSTYLTLSTNVTRFKTELIHSNPYKPLTMNIKSKSIFFSFLPCTLNRSTGNLTFSLPDGSTYTILCTVHSSSPAHVVTKLFVKIRFALNTRLQLVCVANTLYEEVLGEMKLLTNSEESRNSHVPVGTLERIKFNRTRVFVRTGLDNKKLQRGMEVKLVFSMWRMMKHKEIEKTGCVYKVDDIVKSLRDKMNIDAGRVCEVAGRYKAIFTNSHDMVYLNSPTNSYWSELLLLCPDIIPVSSFQHLPLSPLNLGVTVGNNKVVLRDLQGMLLPSEECKGNVFDVRFRFSKLGSGFLLKLHNSKLKVPSEGLVIPLTLSMSLITEKLIVLGTMGSWKKFKANFPTRKGGEFNEDLELLLDNSPPTILSTIIEEDSIVTLEE